MKLTKSAKAVEIKVKTPINKGIFTIPTYKVEDHNVITFDNSEAKAQYPLQYYIEGKNIRKYPVENTKTAKGWNIRLYQVNTDELIVYEGRR